MKNYRLINNISGWAVFIVAAVTYLMTIEPTASLWDCGEFIACSFKLQVPHPPGAPVTPGAPERNGWAAHSGPAKWMCPPCLWNGNPVGLNCAAVLLLNRASGF